MPAPQTDELPAQPFTCANPVMQAFTGGRAFVVRDRLQRTAPQTGRSGRGPNDCHVTHSNVVRTARSSS